MNLPNLPITEVLDDIRRHLADQDELVVQAPPGAGKTTIVPLALLAESWLADRKILLLEPRRIAARNAAVRMSTLLDEQVGDTVGYRMRMDTRVSSNTRVEVVTEGVLTRMLMSDPSLDGVGLVIFDEFHERNLESDLGLSLSLHARSLFREDIPLKLLAMSATLDTQAICGLLGAPAVTSEGRSFPVDIRYMGMGATTGHTRRRGGAPRGRQPGVVDRGLPVVLTALAEHPDSSLLVFLPGQGEIHGLAQRLSESVSDPEVSIRPIYGNLSLDQQQAAIEPEATGRRKVVLATNIAETSLTIEGVDVVIDSGLRRAPRFDPRTAMTRLEAVRISRASADQRAGRAGRLRPGFCYRLWSRDQQSQMAGHDQPEIADADLAPLALQLLRWGVHSPDELDWLDPPPAGAWSQAIALLESLGAVRRNAGALPILTSHGESMSEIATHPRLAHMMLCAAGERQLARSACRLAAVLSDRDPFSRDQPDMRYRLEVLDGLENCPPRQRGWLNRTKQLADQLERSLAKYVLGTTSYQSLTDDQQAGYLLACAYPDRIARRRHSGGYQLANGRSASLESSHALGKSRWLAVAETGGVARRSGDTIYSAAPLDPTLFENMLAAAVTEDVVTEWDDRAGKFAAERRRCIGNIVLDTQSVAVDESLKQEALLDVVRKRGLEFLPWTPESIQLRARIKWAQEVLDEDWPDLSEARLAEWLGPYLTGVNRIVDFKRLDMVQVIRSQFTWEQGRTLDALLPERLEVPSGNHHRIDYTESPPALAVKLQEMFAVTDTPTVARGRIALSVKLLSPAGRPLQITQDLAAFWANAYQDVKKEMRGRYPKHPWPDDPLTATPTGKTKGR